MSVIDHCLVDEQAFKEAVWSIDRSSFRPGDALDAFERAKVKGAEPSTTQEAVKALREIAAAEIGSHGMLTETSGAALVARARLALQHLGGQ